MAEAWKRFLREVYPKAQMHIKKIILWGLHEKKPKKNVSFMKLISKNLFELYLPWSNSNHDVKCPSVLSLNKVHTLTFPKYKVCQIDQLGTEMLPPDWISGEWMMNNSCARTSQPSSHRICIGFPQDILTRFSIQSARRTLENNIRKRERTLTVCFCHHCHPNRWCKWKLFALSFFQVEDKQDSELFLITFSGVHFTRTLRIQSNLPI